MKRTVHFPPVPGDWVKEEEYDRVVKQRDQLREALENVMHYVETDDMRTLDLNKARAALKATEEK